MTEDSAKFFADAREMVWADVNPDLLEDGTKTLAKKVKGCHKETKWSSKAR